MEKADKDNYIGKYKDNIKYSALGFSSLTTFKNITI